MVHSRLTARDCGVHRGPGVCVSFAGSAARRRNRSSSLVWWWLLPLRISPRLVVLAQLAALLDRGLDAWRRRASGSTRTSSTAIVLELGDLFGVGVLEPDLAGVYRVHPTRPAHGVVSGVKVLSLVDFLGQHVLLGRQLAVELENPLLFGRQRRHVDLVCTVGVERRHVWGGWQQSGRWMCGGEVEG